MDRQQLPEYWPLYFDTSDETFDCACNPRRNRRCLYHVYLRNGIHMDSEAAQQYMRQHKQAIGLDRL